MRAVKCCSAGSKAKGVSFKVFALCTIWVDKTIRMASTSKRNSAGMKFHLLRFVSSKVESGFYSFLSIYDTILFTLHLLGILW